MIFTCASVFSYGDECLGGKLSLLHFCVTFLMAGVIVLVVGAVQFKPEAEMFEYRQVIVTLGCAILGFGERILGENIQIKYMVSQEIFKGHTNFDIEEIIGKSRDIFENCTLSAFTQAQEQDIFTAASLKKSNFKPKFAFFGTACL